MKFNYVKQSLPTFYLMIKYFILILCDFDIWFGFFIKDNCLAAANMQFMY